MELVIYNMYLRVSTGVHQTNNGSLDALGHRHDIDRDKISVHARDIIFHVICFLRGPIARNPKNPDVVNLKMVKEALVQYLVGTWGTSIIPSSLLSSEPC